MKRMINSGQLVTVAPCAASDLNTLLGRAEYSLGVSPDETDIAFAKATLEIVERVATFEHLVTQK